MKKEKMNKKGLTLIELLTAMSIVAILLVLLVPQIGSAIEKAREVGVLNDFNSYRISAKEAVMKDNKISEEQLNKNLDKILKFENGESKKQSPFNEKYYLFVTEEGYNIITESKKKRYILTINKNGETTSTFEDEGYMLGGEIISKPNGQDAPKYESDEEDFEYYVTDQDEIAITGYKGKNPYLVIPKQIIGKNVTRIHALSFTRKGENYVWGMEGKSSVVLKSVVIPNGLKNIDAQAFTLNDLKSITIPESVTKIGQSAFSGNKNAKFYISKNNANYKTSENNTGIYSKNGDTIYFGTQGTFEAKTYENVKKIDIYAFIMNDIGLVYIPKNMNNINILAFMYNGNLKFNVSSENTFYANGDNNEGLYNKNLTYLISASRGVFTTNTYKNVEKLGGTSFYGADLNYAFIPKSVNEIESYAFNGNKDITFEVEEGHAKYKAGERGLGLYNITMDTLIFGSEEVFDTNSFKNIKTIGYSAFYEAGITKNVIIPEGIEIIGQEAFMLNHFEELELPSTLRTIYNTSFIENLLLKKVTNKSNVNLNGIFNNTIEIKNR